MDNDEHDIDTAHPWLVIPYFAGDEGLSSQRPLTKVSPPVISWLCPAIRVQGVNYTTAAGTYLSDEPLQITVDVDNRGVPNALVKLQVYWSNPGTGFLNPTLILTASKPVPGRSVAGPTRFPPMLWTPEAAKVPPHFCLLARVSCTPPEPYPAPAAPSPMDDRHWAQYNLQSALLNAAGSYATVFWAVNPLAEATAYTVTATPLEEEQLQAMARIVRAEPVEIRSHQVALSRAADDGRDRQPQDASVVLALERGERQALVVATRDLALGPQQFTAVQMVQTRVGDDRGGEATGSLGLVLFGHVEEGYRPRRR